MSIEKEINQVASEQEYSGVDQWYTIFKEATPEKAMEYLNADAIDKCEYVDEFDEDTALVTGPSSRVVVTKDGAITGFPFIKGKVYTNLVVQDVNEIEEADGYEGIVTAVHSSGTEVKFFATDYAINSDNYSEEAEVKVALTGLAYDVSAFDANKFAELTDADELHADFCIIMPMKYLGSYFVVGRVKSFEKHLLGEIKGHLFKLDVAADFELSIFVRDENLHLPLAVGVQIQASVWLSGTTEE